MKTLGVIGGLGPMATAYFLQLIIQMNDANVDQEHIDTVVISKVTIPDRTKYILDNSNKNPVQEMIMIGNKLQEIGAEIIAIPCITAHYFHKELERDIDIPIINALEKTAQYLKQRGIEKAGILATDGTIESNLFQNIFDRYGITCLVPEIENQKKVMCIIYNNIKAGKKVNLEEFEIVSNELFAKGAQVILLGCTELSLIKRDCNLAHGYLDVMEILAQEAVLNCGKLREKYKELIT